jgi:pimeloyl-ACP methyl ester carboxylesterase
LNLRTRDGITLSNLLFKTDSAKGVILYLHGNSGSLRLWGEVAQTYTDLHYDVCMVDYRGYGKSGGSINGQEVLFKDINLIYDTLQKLYGENKIVVLGYSIGTGPAAEVASAHHPRKLILQAPYCSLIDIMHKQFPVIPPLILKYPLNTSEYLMKCTAPVVIFHGDEDEVIYYGSSLKLKQRFKTGDTLITLHGWGHNGMSSSPEYLNKIKLVLQ